jgi:surface antigen
MQETPALEHIVTSASAAGPHTSDRRIAMAQGYCSIVVCLAAAGLGAACASELPEADSVGLTTAALSMSICEEAVPANRNIDGIPSYAQCAASMDGAIYSNNGVDTSLTQMGSDWIRTQWSGGYQCTELANRYLRFRWGVKWIPNGNAGNWCDTQPPANAGIVQTMAPVHGDLMVLAPGSCGAAQGTGHVTVVDEVNDTKLVVVEQNGARRGNYNLSCAKCFLHVMANDGVPKAAAGTAAAGAAAPATPTTPPAQGAAGGAAIPEGPRRPRNPAAGGSAAPASSVAGAASAPLSPAVPTTPVAPANTPVIVPAAGSGAVAPLASAVTTPTASTRVGAPEAGACAVAAVGSGRSYSFSLLFGLGMLFGAALRPRTIRSLEPPRGR